MNIDVGNLTRDVIERENPGIDHEEAKHFFVRGLALSSINKMIRTMSRESFIRAIPQSSRVIANIVCWFLDSCVIHYRGTDYRVQFIPVVERHHVTDAGK